MSVSQVSTASRRWSPACRARQVLVGKFLDSSASTGCANCASGWVQPSTNATSCVQCGPGEFAKFPGKACEPCPAGRASATGTNLECRACPLGRVQPNLKSTVCQECEPGKFRKDPAELCSSCVEGFFAVFAGQPNCTRCPTSSTSNDRRTGCVCANHTFVASTGNASELNCKRCPQGLTFDCGTQAGFPLSEILAHPHPIAMNGQWVSSACPGGA